MVFKLRPRVAYISLSFSFSTSLPLFPNHYLSNHAWGRHSLGSYRYIIFVVTSGSRVAVENKDRSERAGKFIEILTTCFAFTPSKDALVQWRIAQSRYYTEHEHHVPGRHLVHQAPRRLRHTIKLYSIKSEYFRFEMLGILDLFLLNKFMWKSSYLE